MFFFNMSLGQKNLPVEKIQYYKVNNIFSYPNESFSLSVEDFFGVLKDSIEKVKGNKIKAIMGIIKKYDNAIKKNNTLINKYNRGVESDNGLGRQGTENTFLINNSKVWYMWSLVIGILPAMPWLIEYQKQQKIDKEIREKSYYSGEGANPEYYRPMIALGIKPGILLGLIGFIGSKIKLGEKPYFIEHGSVQKPKLYEILSENEINMVLNCYNEVIIN